MKMNNHAKSTKRIKHQGKKTELMKRSGDEGPFFNFNTTGLNWVELSWG